jgi:hypothetical protein
VLGFAYVKYFKNPKYQKIFSEESYTMNKYISNPSKSLKKTMLRKGEKKCFKVKLSKIESLKPKTEMHERPLFGMPNHFKLKTFLKNVKKLEKKENVFVEKVLEVFVEKVLEKKVVNKKEVFVEEELEVFVEEELEVFVEEELEKKVVNKKKVFVEEEFEDWLVV